MITDITNFYIRRITTQDIVYSDKSVLDFSHNYQVRFVPTFSSSDPSTQALYYLQLQYSLPNSNTWNNEVNFIVYVSAARVSGQLVSTNFSLSNVSALHRQKGTKYRFYLTSQDILPSSPPYYSDCLFVPPALYLMNPQNNWVVGQPYIRIGNEWKEVKTVFVYKDGNWHESIIS